MPKTKLITIAATATVAIALALVGGIAWGQTPDHLMEPIPGSTNLSYGEGVAYGIGFAIGWFLIWPPVVAGYFAPTFIAMSRHHRHRWWIYYINYTLGLTVIGWICVFIWARRKRQQAIPKRVEPAIAALVMIAFLVLASSSAFAANDSLTLTESAGGTFSLSVRINDKVEIPFGLDTGAGDVSLPEDVFSTLKRSGTVSDSDFIGIMKYTLADGSTTTGRQYRIHKMSVGDHVVTDVVAGVGPIAAIPLLGQSFLSKLPAWSIDYGQKTLVFNPDLAGYQSQIGMYKAQLAESQQTADRLMAQLTEKSQQIVELEKRVNLALVEKQRVAAPTSLATLTPATAQPDSAAFNQGRAEREVYEDWFNSLSEGDYKAGALYWASVRSRPEHAIGCRGAGYTGTLQQADWANGCAAAKSFLDQSDVKRLTNNSYRAGWNSIP